MSLLLKALKQAEKSGAKPNDSGLELEPLADAGSDGGQARGWVEPPGLVFGNAGASAQVRPARSIHWPRLSLIPGTLLVAALVAIGYGIYLYFALQPPATPPTRPAPEAAAAPEPTSVPPQPVPAAEPTVTPPAEPAPAAVLPVPATGNAPRAAPAPRDRGAEAPRTLPQFQPDAQASLLAQAYAAYQRGALAEAQRLYTQAQARQPGPDALLGLAAIAVLQNREADAQRLYREVLERDPRNATAQAALLDLLGNTDGAATESRLKLLIEREPSPHVYQTLGNVYAEQGRWRDAQAAYFESWRGAPGNADYAYNLAVSLDQLREHAAALTYYEKALAAGGAHRFERAQAEARVRQLQQAR